MDRLGATDAWLMFSMWMAANGHTGGSICALLIAGLYCFLPSRKASTTGGPL